MVDEILNKLEVFKTKEFTFDPIFHKYKFKGNHYVSVTQFISRFHQKFDQEYWSKYTANKTDKSQDEILKEWAELNQRSNEIGTGTHNWIEGYFKRKYFELPIDLDIIDRINKFNVAFVKYLHKLTPIAFENKIFSKRWKIAGTIDSIFIINGMVVIIDYKTNKDFTDDNHPKGKYEKLLFPFNDFYKNHLNEYSIQVSLYKLILKEIGINVSNCYLLYIGPDSDAKMIKCRDFTDILENYLSTQDDLLIK